jgi:hypothetical protein
LPALLICEQRSQEIFLQIFLKECQTEIELEDISEEMLNVPMTKKGPGSLWGKRRVMFFLFSAFASLIKE